MSLATVEYLEPHEAHLSCLTPTVIDVFSGVGGMSLGFQAAGFRTALAVDNDETLAHVHEANFPTTPLLLADMSQLSGQRILAISGLKVGELDCLIGGPPCQGFSVIGAKNLDDPRNSLILEFARLVSELQPKYFVMENVRGLLHNRYMTLMQEFTDRIHDSGFAIVKPVKLLNAADFQTPQQRNRVIVIGVREGLPLPKYPSPCSNPASVADAIADLAAPCEAISRQSKTSPYLDQLNKRYGCVPGSKQVTAINGITNTQHSEKVVSRFRRVEPGSADAVSRFIRLRWNGTSPTLRAGTKRDRGSHTAARPIHPSEDRCINVREAARLHSFPDWFEFHHTTWHGLRQIGNAVPPNLAYAVALQIQLALDRANCESSDCE